MSDPNPDLQQLQSQLSDTMDQLNTALGTATTADQAQAIAGQIGEVNHRITLTGQLLFHAQTQAITDAVKDVQAGAAAVDQAIAQIANLVGFINTMSSFLGLVDKAIDAAKAL